MLPPQKRVWLLLYLLVVCVILNSCSLWARSQTTTRPPQVPLTEQQSFQLWIDLCQAATDSGCIAVTVVNDEDEAPVPDIYVVIEGLGGMTGKTDQHGKYRWSQIAVGLHKVRVVRFHSDSSITFMEEREVEIQAGAIAWLTIRVPNDAPRTANSTAIAPMQSVTPAPTLLPSVNNQTLNNSLVLSVENTGAGLRFWATEPLNPEHPTRLAEIPGEIRGYAMSLSPKFLQVAVAVTYETNSRINGELLIVDLRTDTVHRLASDIDLGRYLNYPLWSPDGQYVTVLRQSNDTFPYKQSIVMIHTQTGQETVLAQEQIENENDNMSLSMVPLGWSQDSSNLYIQKGLFGAVDLWLVQRSSLTPKRVRSIVEQGVPRCYFIAPDGANLLCSHPSSNVQSYTLLLIPTTANTDSKVLVTMDAEGLSDPIWSPDGRSTMLGLYNPSTQRTEPVVVDVQTGAVSRIFVDAMEFSGTSLFPVVWSPDGSWLIAATSEVEARYLLTSVKRQATVSLILPQDATVIGWVEQLPHLQGGK